MYVRDCCLLCPARTFRRASRAAVALVGTFASKSHWNRLSTPPYNATSYVQYAGAAAVAAAAAVVFSQQANGRAQGYSTKRKDKMRQHRHTTKQSSTPTHTTHTTHQLLKRAEEYARNGEVADLTRNDGQARPRPVHGPGPRRAQEGDVPNNNLQNKAFIEKTRGRRRGNAIGTSNCNVSIFRDR